MLRMLAYVVAAIFVVAAGVLIYATTRPDSFRVQRSASIKAPPDRIFALISDLRGWNAWSPYERKDPAMRRTFSGAASGTGAIYEWDGDRNVGKGRMEVIEATPPGRILIKLDFIKPFEGHNTAEFTLEPKGDNTLVTWAMYGPATFMMKVMGIFMNMDNMIGNDFAVGLANLKGVTEK
jgi:uncharacterized protein YndB with AHSA1/START domain